MNDKDSYFHPFPRRLRLLFDETRVSQQEVADFVGVSRQAVSQWKDGKTIPDCYNFKKVAEFFKVPLEYLYGETESKVKENQALVDSLRLSDQTIAKLQHWAKMPPFFRFSLPELVSEIIDAEAFNGFILSAYQVVSEYAEHQLDLHQNGGTLRLPDEEAQALAQFDLDGQARMIGLRIIRAENLADFYRNQAMESIGHVLDEISEKYYEENSEQLIEGRLYNGEHNETDEQEG